MPKEHPQWEKFATQREKETVTRLDEQITSLMVKVSEFKSIRKPILARCNLRAWRAEQEKKRTR
jgi:hypothetical protein